MKTLWKTIQPASINELIQVLVELEKKKFFFRGHTRCIKKLIPVIDRGKLSKIDRKTKLICERKAIETFRTCANSFSNDGEKKAIHDDFIALMVLQHYGVPTRLLDWTKSPYISLCFAVSGNIKKDAEIWAFHHDEYAKKGALQWKKFPQTTTDNSGDPNKFAAGLTAFSNEEPPSWIIAAFYDEGFPRQNAQQGLYSMTSCFCKDHAIEFGKLLEDPELLVRIIIKHRFKKDLLIMLRDKYKVTKETLFPDTAGAANTAKEKWFSKYLN